MKASLHIGLLFLMGFPLFLPAQYKFNNVVKIGKESGLPNLQISAIAKDKEGFMWLGTQNGLCRFDGASVKVFQPDVDSLLPQPHYIVNSIFVDSNKIWVGHEYGLSLFSCSTERFRELALGEPGSKKGLRAIFKDEKGDMWLGVRFMGIVRLKKNTEEFTTYHYPVEENTDVLPVNRLNEIIDMVQDVGSDSIIWAATLSGLLRLNKNSGKVDWFYHLLEHKHREANFNEFHVMHQEPDGKLYLGTYYEGVKIFDPGSNTFSNLPITGKQYPGLFTNSEIQNITGDNGSGYLWITSRDGLLQYDLKGQHFTRAIKNEKDGARRKYGITFVDEAGRIWYAPSFSGIFLYDPLLQQFDFTPSYRFRPEKIGSIPRKIIEDKQTGDLTVVGQFSDGVMHLDRSSSSWATIPPPMQFRNEEYFNCRGMVKYEGGSYLILKSDFGLLIYDPEQARIRAFPHQPEVGYVELKSMIRDHRGRIWIGTHQDGLIRFEPESRQFTYFRRELQQPGLDVFPLDIASLFIDSRQDLWIRRDQGYSVFLNERDTFLNFLHPVNRRNPIHVENFAEDRNGKIWMAGGGEPFLYYADVNHPEKGTFGKIRVFPEIKDRVEVLCVEAGPKGNIWALTTAGLVCLNPDSLSIRKFSREYGIPGLGFYMECLSTGEMAAGPRDRLCFFWPDSLRINTELPKPYITRLKVFDQDFHTEASLRSKSNINLSYKQNFFSIEYSAIAYTFPDQASFQYKLDGFDENWTDARKRQYAAYTNVPAGSYTFLIRAINSEGLLNKEPYELNITIIPPWWKTIWANLLFTALFFGSLYLFYRFQLNRKLEHAENLRLKELDTVKTKLYTNITHEFRTPLTIILGMARQIRENPEEWLHKGLRMITRNGENLLQLVNQMLALRKLESGTMRLKLIQGNVVAYLKYIFESFQSVAEAGNIELQMQAEPEELYMDYDPEKLQMIVSNLLSNAIKFTKPGGEVCLTVDGEWGTADVGRQTADDRKKTAPYLLFTVKDTGSGIPMEKLPHIFERFYQADDSATRMGEGAGIGLTLAKELVNLMGGRIEVKSEVGKGSVFTVILPITRKASAKEAMPADTGIEPRQVIASQIPENERVKSSPNSRAATGQTGDERPLLLVIEDNPELIIYIKACLKGKYALSTAANGREGIEKALEEVPDLIISDVMMPEKDGYEVCQTLKNDRRSSHIPIILLTAKADTDSRLEGLEQGADAYLAKPFNEKELNIRIRKLLELRQALRRHYLAQVGIGEEAKTQSSSETEQEDLFLQKIRAIVEDNLSDSHYTIPQLCTDVGMSHPQLHRKLTALTGLSANRFLRSIRLAKAKTLLLTTQLAVSEIAYDTGFSDPAYFARVFGREVGMPPTEYREG